MTRYAVTEKGERKEKAAPELLPEHMRRLPGELLTREIEVEDKVHQADPPHIVKALASDYADKAAGKRPYDPNAEPPGPEVAAAPKLTQEVVDIRRLCVMRRWAQTQKERILAGKQPDMDVKHLCFPDPGNHGNYAMHDGNQSACIEGVRINDRWVPCHSVKHLRKLNLAIDIAAGRLPETIIARLRDNGVAITSAHERFLRSQLNINKVLTPEGTPWTQ